jgi:MFS family permease
MPFTGLWRNRDFMPLWAGQTISKFGSQIGDGALQFAAILVLGASPVQLGLLAAARTAPVLLFGLLAGAWVDRLRRRPILIAADLGRGLLLCSIPAAALLGVLGMEQLYIVTALVSLMSLFFDVAYQSYLPALVRRDQLVEGNSKLSISDSVAEIAGPPLGGGLVQLISAPLAILIDALSFLASALALALIRVREPVPPPAQRQHIWHDIVEGLLGRVNASAGFPMAGAGLVGALLGGALGQAAGLRVALAVGLVGMLLSSLERR